MGVVSGGSELFIFLKVSRTAIDHTFYPECFCLYQKKETSGNHAYGQYVR